MISKKRVNTGNMPFSRKDGSGTFFSKQNHDNPARANLSAFFTRGVIQPKLKIGRANDKFEQEADAVADRVMRMESKGEGLAQPTQIAPAVQRTCPECEEEERVQMKESDQMENEVPSVVDDVIKSSGGKKLDNNTRAFMENSFGYDFGHVNIHDNSMAAKSAQSINALAYTVGNSIVFNEGQYASNTHTGKKLLAHELTHVVQQRAVGENPVPSKQVQRVPTIEIVDENFVGPLQQHQRRAAASCPVRCNGVTDVGTLHAMGLFYHRSRTGVRDVPAATDNGVGTALHFMENTGRTGCPCDDFKIVQVISTTHPLGGRIGSGYVDNGGRNTPFYSDVYAGGSGEHTISITGGFRDKGERVDTTHSIYDTPFRGTAGQNSTITWQAEACVACIRNAQPDLILGGASYGFRIPYNPTTRRFGTIQGIGPYCVSVPSYNFVRTLRTDATVAGYNFVPELGPGDFPMTDPNVRYA